MTRSRAFAANGTDRFLLNVDNKPESIGVAFNAIQNQNVRAWKKGLRMAWRKCHRSPTLKHFRLTLFYADCTKMAEEPRSFPVVLA